MKIEDRPGPRQWHLKLLGLFSGTGIRTQIAKASATSVILKALSAFLAFGSSIILARSLGPEGYGLYAYVLAIITVIALPAKAGLPQLITRETAKAQLNKDLAAIKGVWRWSTLLILGLSLGVITLSLLIMNITSSSFTDENIATLGIALILVPLLGLVATRAAALRGLGFTIQGQLPELAVRPVMFFVLLLAFPAFYWDGSMTPKQSLTLNATATALALLASTFLLYRNCPPAIQSTAPRYYSGSWTKAIIPMAAINGMHLVNTQADILLIGIFNEGTDVGHYRVAAQTSLIVAFGLQGTKMVVEPHFSRLYNKNDLVNLQRLSKAASRLNLGVALLIIIPIVFFGPTLIALAFGPAFTAAYLPMTILAIGRLLGSSLGSSGHLLNMAGYQKKYSYFWLFAAALNILLNLALIPPFGTTGAAIATSISLLSANILSWWAAKRWIGCDCSPL